MRSLIRRTETPTVATGGDGFSPVVVGVRADAVPLLAVPASGAHQR